MSDDSKCTQIESSEHDDIMINLNDERVRITDVLYVPNLVEVRVPIIALGSFSIQSLNWSGVEM